jgi:hypothetical protein
LDSRYNNLVASGVALSHKVQMASLVRDTPYHHVQYGAYSMNSNPYIGLDVNEVAESEDISALAGRIRTELSPQSLQADHSVR